MATTSNTSIGKLLSVSAALAIEVMHRGMAVVAKREIAETDRNVHQGKVQKSRAKTGQASAQNTIAHKPSITTMAPAADGQCPGISSGARRSSPQAAQAFPRCP